MDYSEKWGRDVDEAVRLALEDLALTEDQVMVTVLEEPAKGFLGLGSKLAKVRVEKLHIEDENKAGAEGADNKKDEKRANRDLRKKNKPQGDRRGDGAAPSGGQRRSEEHSQRNDRGGRNDRYNRNDRGEKNERRENRGSASDEDFGDFDFSSKPSFSERPENLTEVVDNVASLFLKDIISNMRLDVEVKAFKNDDCIFLEVSGIDAKTVIGKRGQTLDSIQYLTNLVANKERADYQRVIIDVEGYRSRREKTLERLAAKLARKVQKTGRSVRLEPMNPYERKVIHSTLMAFEDVKTRSEGEEPYRRVVIEKK
ncbi:MAG: Jag N-terminal domain-containing protein [Clostridiales Family XIII bacterium]|jgi:spoIIIJ-associated protein|nr:Jag N-terminal domain-containing protein [Clostridiales Family XIII bacterium]